VEEERSDVVETDLILKRLNSTEMKVATILQARRIQVKNGNKLGNTKQERN